MKKEHISSHRRFELWETRDLTGFNKKQPSLSSFFFLSLYRFLSFFYSFILFVLLPCRQTSFTHSHPQMLFKEVALAYTHSLEHYPEIFSLSHVFFMCLCVSVCAFVGDTAHIICSD